ncbi:AT-rich interactive domain-containing protein 2 [Nymphaea thermarum]|nr:AT-rich interactive domain-containing protein 2 [Nymphaea thermarum]
MAGWSSCAYQSLNNLRVSGFRSKESSEFMDQLRSVFDEVLVSSLKEVPAHESRPLPAILGDGRSVDLFKLYFTVKERGGYHSIPNNGSWASIAQELGFESRFGAPLKLVYLKYLSGLDRWFRKLGSDNAADCTGEGPELASVGSGKRGLEVCIDLADEESGLDCETGDQKKESPPVIYVASDDDEGDGDCQTSPSSEQASLQKRKQESLVGMLNWLKVVALSPCDPDKGRIVEGSGKKDDRVEECCTRVLVARKVMFRRRNDDFTRGGPCVQKKQRIHPSIYEDNSDSLNHAPEKVRSSQRLVFLKSRSPRTCSISTLMAKPDSVKPSSHARSPESCDGPPSKELPRSRVPIGSDFQASVPEWSGVASDTSVDSKWLGTQTWPYPGACCSPVTEDEIGKGRPECCTCISPGSIGCVKRHISDARLRLRYELGSAFYAWKFNEMGEDVAISWSLNDEQIFKTIVRLNPLSLEKNFWKEAYLCFPSRSKQSLVSYYFNVFVLRRRSFQSRVTPDNVDSDDDEYEFGMISDTLAPINAATSSFKARVCVQNMQCDDFEMPDVDEQFKLHHVN